MFTSFYRATFQSRRSIIVYLSPLHRFFYRLNRENCVTNDAGSSRSSSRRSTGQLDLEKGRFGSPRGSAAEDFMTPGMSTVNSQLPVKYSRIFAYDPLYDDDDEKDCEC